MLAKQSLSAFQSNRLWSKRFIWALLLSFVGCSVVFTQISNADAETLTPPATPLVTCDPYFSIWSPAARLHDTDTTHWTGKPHRLTCLARIDGKTYRVMGAHPDTIAPLPQTDLTVWPTTTRYQFTGAGVELSLSFATPALPTDLDLLSRPITYLTFQARSIDGQSHNVHVYMDAEAEIAVNSPEQKVTCGEDDFGDLMALRVGSEEQAILARKGDDLRIDWGHFYLAALKSSVDASAIGAGEELRRQFVEELKIGAETDPEAAVPANERSVALTIPLGIVEGKSSSRWLMLAYDDLFSIRYMARDMRPYWRRNGWEAQDLLEASAKEYSLMIEQCDAFDQELMSDLTNAGGENYAKLAALAYRQCFAAGKFVADANGQPISFCKENHSNGCIATSDVFYPMSPQFLLFGPSLAKSFLVPFMDYASSDRWKFPFAPHDLGTYPHANGQVYGGGEHSEENQMPIEECGNLLILMGAVAQMEGNADFAGLYWEPLTRWAEYLAAKGFDPENQLCTDDFSGHLAHNVNLSAKAICGLGAYAKLCALRGDDLNANKYQTLASQFAARWQEAADSGDHYRLAFDKPETWSQKYNLVWDRLLDLGLFPESVARKEMDYYLKMQNEYGLPLDNRSTYTKLDWILWTATLTEQDSDFHALVDPVIKFLNETPDRSPMTDWYHTHNARKVGFTARPVVGGVFLRMLYDSSVWEKWSNRDQTWAKNYAPMPKPPIITTMLPTAREESVAWRYAFERPPEGWQSIEFDDSAWNEGHAGFGEDGTPGATNRTRWNSSDIWLRRTFDLPEDLSNETLWLYLHHDEDAEVYINGVLAVRVSGYTTDYTPIAISTAARAALKPTENTFAVHCTHTRGGQFIDVGLVTVEPAEE